MHVAGIMETIFNGCLLNGVGILSDLSRYTLID